MISLNVLSLFDGMSCGQIALARAGINIDKYYAAEIDANAIRVTQANYPSTIQLWDVTKVTANMLPKIDLLIGGSPCQGFSCSGKGLNFEDPRSKLFFEFVRLLNETKPKYFLLENVKMKKEYQDIISQHLGVEPIEINSNLVSAQNRRRLYWTNIPNVKQPQDKQIFWGNVRETGVNSQKYYYTEKALQWLGRHSIAKGKIFSVHQDNEKMQMVEASHYKKYSSQRFFGIVDTPEDEYSAIRERYWNSEGSLAKKIVGSIEFRRFALTNSLMTFDKDGIGRPFYASEHGASRRILFSLHYPARMRAASNRS